MKQLIATTLLGFGIAISVADHSEADEKKPISLVCSGMLYQDNPKGIDSIVTPTASSVDLERHLIDTPLGTFRIIGVEETRITFDDPKSQLKVSGSLDRITGHMTIFWVTPEEDKKADVGQPWRDSRFSELTCTVSKQLF